MNPIDGILTGQPVDPDILERAKQLRNQATPEEKILWGHLRANRMAGFHFRRQQVIQGYIVDFYCHRASLVIELDGPIHQSQTAYDHERDEQLKNMGLKILHIRNDEITHELDETLKRIAGFLMSA